MTIKEMQDNVIQKYGFETEETILFFELCEAAEGKDWGLYLELVYNYLMER